jgi:hypothetical protein
MTIKRIAPLSAGKVFGTLYALMGLIVGAMFSLFAAMGAMAGPDTEALGPLAMLFGVGAIVLIPIFYGCMGAIVTIISAWLYNVVAGMVGGLEVDLS